MPDSAATAFQVDLAVVSTDAVSVSGVSIASANAARVAAAMVAHARRVVVACAPECIGTGAFGAICRTEVVNEVVTWNPGLDCRGINPGSLRAIADLGTMVSVVEKPPECLHP